MAMSNFIDEAERLAEIYGSYSERQRRILQLVGNLDTRNNQPARVLHNLQRIGINREEIGWLKRTGHLLLS